MKARWHSVKNKKELEALYRSLIPTLREVARKCGYALGVHGSLRRDLDLIAAPWTKNALSAETLVIRIEAAVCKYRFLRTRAAVKAEGKRNDQKPHGRVAYTITLGPNIKGTFTCPYIDLSVMPRQ